MKTKETLKNSIIKWWQTIDGSKLREYSNKYYGNADEWNYLEYSEIENIYQNEMEPIAIGWWCYLGILEQMKMTQKHLTADDCVNISFNSIFLIFQSEILSINSYVTSFRFLIDSETWLKSFYADSYYEKSKYFKNRRDATDWWNDVKLQSKIEYSQMYFKGRLYISLSEREIEYIYGEFKLKSAKEQLKLLQDQTIIYDICPDSIPVKPNQKIFQTYSSELFKKYILKFSDEDKKKALKDLTDILDNK